MVGLYSFGNSLIRMIGPVSTILLYTGSAVTGALLSLKLQPTGYVPGRGYILDYEYLGAIGGVLGMMTVFTAFFPNRMVPILPGIVVPAWLETIGFAAYSCYAHFQGIDQSIGQFLAIFSSHRY